jgi:alkylation response protein AidB-like acyl-CoA dehydrogenase
LNSLPVSTLPEEDLVRFAFTDEQEELRDSVRRFLARRSPEPEIRRLMADELGYDPGFWREIGEQQGLQGLAIPEEYGGLGFGIIEQAVVFEELGRANACLPYFATVALAANLLLAVPDPSARRDYLPGIALGRTIATVALLEEAGRWDAERVRLTAEPSGDGWILRGEKLFVIDGASADLILVVARAPEGVSIFAVEPGADGADKGFAAAPLRTMDLTRKQSRLRFDGTPARLIGTPGAGWPAVEAMMDRAAVALACEQVGGARWCLRTAVDYAGVREQFGQVIGSFQAVKHKSAELLLHVEQAASAAYHAVWAVADVEAGAAPTEGLPLAASLAKACCSRAFETVSAETIQLLGGIGFTWEHPAHLYFRRARASAVLLGNPQHHLDRMTGLAGL